jgi:hypothetical protein
MHSGEDATSGALKYSSTLSLVLPINFLTGANWVWNGIPVYFLF